MSLTVQLCLLPDALGNRLVIVGAGGFGRHVFDLVSSINSVDQSWSFVGFADDHVQDGLWVGKRQIRVVSNVDQVDQVDASWVVAIGAPDVRAKLVGRLPVHTAAPSFVHPTAWIGGDVELGLGVVVCAGARITTNVRIGDHTHINMNAIVSHDSRIGEFVTLSPGAIVNGNVTIDDRAFLGTASSVLPGIHIGESAVVGAGAVVTMDVAPGTTVVGVPARCITRVN
jgi:sugar O-acyltransferase (sialic acid O-acetyltransferase NeuD family)